MVRTWDLNTFWVVYIMAENHQPARINARVVNSRQRFSKGQTRLCHCDGDVASNFANSTRSFYEQIREMAADALKMPVPKLFLDRLTKNNGFGALTTAGECCGGISPWFDGTLETCGILAIISDLIELSLYSHVSLE